MRLDEDGFERDEFEAFNAKLAAHALLTVLTIALLLVAVVVVWKVFSPAA